MPLERLHHLLRFAGAQQTVIHKDAGETIADGAVDQRGRHRAVHAAAQPADHPTIRPDLRPDPFNALLNKMAGCPVPGAAADPAHEVLQQLKAIGRMRHLRVKLEPVQRARLVGDRRARRIPAARHRREAGRQPLHPVAVAHPHRLLARLPGKQAVLPRHLDLRRAVFAHDARRDMTPQRMGQQLQPVADAQHRRPALQHNRRQVRRARLIDAGRPARKDDALQVDLRQPLGGAIPGDHLGVDIGLPHPAADQLAVLAAVVQHSDRFMLHGPAVIPFQ